VVQCNKHDAFRYMSNLPTPPCFMHACWIIDMTWEKDVCRPLVGIRGPQVGVGEVSLEWSENVAVTLTRPTTNPTVTN
jgi:hypothetical protein